MFNLWFSQSWAGAVLSADAFQRRLLKDGLPPDDIEARLDAWNAATEGELLSRTTLTPLNGLHALDHGAPYYREWLAHPDYDTYWARADLESEYANIVVPILSRGGWYDIFSGGTIANFIGLQLRGGSEAARRHSRLTMVPMCHGPCPDSNAIHFPFGMLWAGSTEPRWWDYWLKGIDAGFTKDPPVKLFVMILPDRGRKGSGYWIGADQYPLAATRWTRWYLHSHGRANTRKGNGTLTTQPPPGSEPADRFVYDPRNPVPTLGGKLCCVDLVPAGVFDQSQIELRDDVLVYTSAPLEKELVVVGPALLSVWAATTAPDTDFTAKLVDVRPDGVALNLLDSVVTARLRQGSKKQPAPIQPDSAYRYELPLGDTGTVFQVGHRIRLEISSSNFPRFARNPNTGGLAESDGDLRRATQTLMHDAAHPSYLELPVIDASKIVLAPSAVE